MANEGNTSGINLPDIREYEQDIEEIIARKKDGSVRHENKKQSQKEAQANAEAIRKCCLETS